MFQSRYLETRSLSNDFAGVSTPATAARTLWAVGAFITFWKGGLCKQIVWLCWTQVFDYIFDKFHQNQLGSLARKGHQTDTFAFIILAQIVDIDSCIAARVVCTSARVRVVPTMRNGLRCGPNVVYCLSADVEFQRGRKNLHPTLRSVQEVPGTRTGTWATLHGTFHGPSFTNCLTAEGYTQKKCVYVCTYVFYKSFI